MNIVLRILSGFAKNFLGSLGSGIIRGSVLGFNRCEEKTLKAMLNAIADELDSKGAPASPETKTQTWVEHVIDVFKASIKETFLEKLNIPVCDGVKTIFNLFLPAISLVLPEFTIPVQVVGTIFVGVFSASEKKKVVVSAGKQFAQSSVEDALQLYKIPAYILRTMATFL